MKKISIIIASKSTSDPKLKECLQSIAMQDYPKELVEVLVITEGTPESAKAIGLKKATGEIVCFMASDCEFKTIHAFQEANYCFTNIQIPQITGVYSKIYYYSKADPILNRYFSLFGFNDPVPFYLGKCDRLPYYANLKFPHREFLNFKNNIPTLGDNGFFVRRDLIMQTDLEHYSHIDNCEDLRKLGYCEYIRTFLPTHHKTGDSLWLWIKKRFHYAESLNQNRRWKMVEIKDIWKIILFGLLAITLIEPTLRSLYGFTKSGIRDKAWFLHPIICFITVFLYGALWVKMQIRKIKKIFHFPLLNLKT